MPMNPPATGNDEILISYRREDSRTHVDALLRALREHFGWHRLFEDTDSISPGQDFRHVFQRRLESCAVLLVVIGEQWLTVKQPHSDLRRLDDPNDYVRVEVAAALRIDACGPGPRRPGKHAHAKRPAGRPRPALTSAGV